MLAIASASNKVPLGSPLSSVSILTFRSTDGLAYTLKARFSSSLSTQLPKAGMLTLVLPDTSHISCIWSASANVTISSLNQLSLGTASSPYRYVSLSTNASTQSSNIPAVSNSDLSTFH
jgi:hypothetical protein